MIARVTFKRLARLGLMLVLLLSAVRPALAASLRWHDSARARDIPVLWYAPNTDVCQQACPVIVFGSGYRIAAKQYSLLARYWASRGFLVVVLQHDLSTDELMPDSGNLQQDRHLFWQRGLANLRFVLRQAQQQWPAADWQHLILAGHSQGGDIASLYLRQYPQQVAALVSLDHRRIALPVQPGLRWITLRSNDQPADPGVVPQQTATAQACVLSLDHVSHLQMSDLGGYRKNAELARAVLRFLVMGQCHL